MKWSELKKAIEEQGVADDTEVGAIDVSNNFKPDVKHVGGQVVISNGERLLADLACEENPDSEALTPE